MNTISLKRSAETLSTKRSTKSSARTFASNLARSLVLKLSKFISKPNIIYDHEGSEPYLSRFYLINGPKSSDGRHPFDEFGRPMPNIVRKDSWSLVLHKFHKSDSTTMIHNHGWTWGLSFILAGGYSEEKLIGDNIERKIVKPFSINLIRSGEFHRVDLLEEDCWTLFLRGPRKSEWSYRARNENKTVQWNEHVRLGADHK